MAEEITASVSQNIGSLLTLARTGEKQREKLFEKTDAVDKKVATVCQQVEQNQKDIADNKGEIATLKATPACEESGPELDISLRGIKARGKGGVDMLKIVLAGLIFLSLVWLIAQKHGIDPPAVVSRILNGVKE